MRALFLTLLGSCLLLAGQDVTGLPAWAQAPALASFAEHPPEDPDAWILFKRTEVTYIGGGEIRTRDLRLVRVLRERGIQQRLFARQTLGDQVGRITALHGWNLRPDGEVVKISKYDLAKRDPDQWGETTRVLVNVALLPRVAKGSLLAFEWEVATRAPLGPALSVYPMEELPIRRWELDIQLKRGLLFSSAGSRFAATAQRFDAWGLSLKQSLDGTVLWAEQLLALPPKERGFPPAETFLPSVTVVFVDDGLSQAPRLDGWDTLAAWVSHAYQEGIVPSGVVPQKGTTPIEKLQALVHWMSRELTYKQVYLSVSRGWLPLPGPEVVRRRNGDCKDHTECFLSEAKGLGFKGYPALCAIQDAEILEDQPLTPYCFNHVIAALQIEQSLGLASEVATPQGRFLLVDTTDRFCPLGFLPADHRDRRVLVCTPAKAVWVRVPESATLLPKAAFDLKGTIQENGSVVADLTVTEQANHLGLRSAALRGGTEALLPRLRAVLAGLPSQAILLCSSVGDPLNIETPFRLEVNVSCPDAARTRGQELVVPAWGLPTLPQPIQKPGQARVRPVQIRHHSSWTYKAVWTLPRSASPILPGLESENPFAKLSWKASGSGSRLELALAYDEKDAMFDSKVADEGVKAWRAHCSLLERLLRDGLSSR